MLLCGMKIFVCSRGAVSKFTSRVKATHVLSILDPGRRPFLHPKTPKKNWLLVHFEDNLYFEEPHGPTIEHVSQILEWGKSLPDDAILLVHCEAGVSRSTAAALALLVQHHGIEKLQECVAALVDVRPEASPNKLVTKLADDLLGCNGELHAAGERIATEKLARQIRESGGLYD